MQEFPPSRPGLLGPRPRPASPRLASARSAPGYETSASLTGGSMVEHSLTAQTGMAIPIRVMTALGKQQAEMGKTPPDGTCSLLSWPLPLAPHSPYPRNHIGQKREFRDHRHPGRYRGSLQVCVTAEKTPYEGGVFRCQLRITSEFPMKPPKGFFLTKIFHPNVSSSGEICVNTLKKDWNPAKWSLRHIFEVIKCLLIVPFPESSLNEEAGKLFMEDFQEFSHQAQMYTKIYARKESAAPATTSQQTSETPLRLSAPIEPHPDKHLYKKSATLGGFHHHHHQHSESPTFEKMGKSISPVRPSKRKVGSFHHKSPENSIFLKNCAEDASPLSFGNEVKGGFIAGALRNGSSLFQPSKPVLNPMTMNVGEEQGTGFTPRALAEPPSSSPFSLVKQQENTQQSSSFFSSALEKGGVSSLFEGNAPRPPASTAAGFLKLAGGGSEFMDESGSRAPAAPQKKDKWMMRRI